MTSTIITSYFQIPSKFPHSTYLEWMENFLSLDVNMVIYTDKESFPVIANLRKTYQNTVIITTSIQDFHVYQYLDYWNYCKSIDREQHTPELYMIWAEKTYMCLHTTKTNPFNSEHFFWCDIGCMRSTEHKLTIKNFLSTSNLGIIGDKMLLSQIENFGVTDYDLTNDGIPVIYKDGQIVNRIQGGFFGGSRKAWEKWADLYTNELKLFIDTKTYGGKDQNIMASIYIKYPEYIKRLHPWSGSIDNKWFSFLNRFSDGPIVTCNLKGGLGNQLFQVSTAMSIAKRDRKRLVLVYSDTIGNRPQYFDSLFSKIDIITADVYKTILSKTGYTTHEEVWNHQYTNIPSTKDSLVLDGYFQTSKYFTVEDVCDTLSFSRHDIVKLDSILGRIYRKDAMNVGLHIRGTDYIDLNWNLDANYYLKAMQLLKAIADSTNTNIKFNVFTDDEPYARTILSGCENVCYVESTIAKESEKDREKESEKDREKEKTADKDIEKDTNNNSDKEKDVEKTITDPPNSEFKDYHYLYALSSMDAYILSNSSYSWWAEYIGNDKKDKPVIAPKKPWLRNVNYNPDIYMKHWALI